MQALVLHNIRLSKYADIQRLRYYIMNLGFKFSLSLSLVSFFLNRYFPMSHT